jgi:alpha-glucosidase
MIVKKITLWMLIVLGFSNCRDSESGKNIKVVLDGDEVVWAGVVRDGHLMPFSFPYEFDFSKDNMGNQIQPLLLTNKGRYFWSEKPFSFKISGHELSINDPHRSVVTGKTGSTLREAQEYIRNKYFPASGLLPDTLLFSAPQYNTWIDLNLNQNQEDIINYAQAIIDNGLPAGVFMIDDTWQEDYGLWNFHPGRFPDPQKMIDQLHGMGFKVMLWICPFVSPDQSVLYHKLSHEKAFLLEKSNSGDTWETSFNPAMIRWWNGVSAVLDFSNPVAVAWFNEQLDKLVNDYHIDGFKFDAGDMRFYPKNTLSKMNLTANEHCQSYTQFGLRFSLNEYRACWKMGGQPLAQRLHDKNHSWEDLQNLIPDMVIAGLSGYTFSCPDMIGGGMLISFENLDAVNQELIVRSAQCHALMPMMQFSVAPWRVLDELHFGAVKKAVEIRKKFIPVILNLARESAKTGEPILTNLEFYFPNQGFESVTDQFMLGTEIMVAPMVESGNARKVKLPEGKWLGDDGQVYQGGSDYSIDVPLDRLPYFTRVR